jgi:hypothetical protein
LGYVCRGEDGESDLVEERLKRVVITAINDGDVDREMDKTKSRVKAGKACADDDDVGAGGWLAKVGHGVHLCMHDA